MIDHIQVEISTRN